MPKPVNKRFRNQPAIKRASPWTRNQPCPTCKQPNKLNAVEKAKGYQCLDCTKIEEGPC
jgi:hypothetical protein